jgi:sulfotransferase
LHAVPDLPKLVQERLYFMRFEDLMEKPVACLAHIYAWLGLPPCTVDPARMAVGIQESDSHYHMKYLHRQESRLVPPARHVIPLRIQTQIETTYAWFYQTYYPKPA